MSGNLYAENIVKITTVCNATSGSLIMLNVKGQVKCIMGYISYCCICTKTNTVLQVFYCIHTEIVYAMHSIMLKYYNKHFNPVILNGLACFVKQLHSICD